MRKFGRRFGFTLAELLIVIGIIGIIAETTIPVLVQEFNDKSIVAQLKKDFTILQQAVTMAVQSDGPVDYWYTGSSASDAATVANQFLSKYLSITQNCGANTGCIPVATKYTALDGISSIGPDFSDVSFSKMILADGTILMINPVISNQQISYIQLSVDVNGFKKPNRWGHDAFTFVVYSEQYAKSNDKKPGQVVPSGNTTGNLSALGAGCQARSVPPPNQPGSRCTTWVLYQGNLDYKYVDDLNWETKTHK